MIVAMPDPTTLILLVRHGETTTTGKVLPGRAKGLHLSEKGELQAHEAARRIGELNKQGSRPIAAVHASPLERTRETARPIAKALGVRTRTNKGLLEADFGSWTGRTLKTLRKSPDWAKVQARPGSFRFPGGESFVDMQNRIWTALLGLHEQHPDTTVVAVSHADPIKAAVAMAAGIHIDSFQRLVISPCSITPILFTSAGPVILAVNSTGDDLSRLVPS